MNALCQMVPDFNEVNHNYPMWVPIYFTSVDKHNKSANTNPGKGEEGFKKNGKEESMQ